jgi:hypothetical protein
MHYGQVQKRHETQLSDALEAGVWSVTRVRDRAADGRDRPSRWVCGMWYVGLVSYGIVGLVVVHVGRWLIFDRSP